ncbi:hypothetical protein V8D89_002276 [Ganoderma adspersum]
MVSSNYNNYNTEVWARWDQYADCLNACFAGRGPHPGDPPVGYREVYTPTPGALRGPIQGMRGVAMSEDAFGALLAQGNHWVNQFTHLAESIQPSHSNPVAAVITGPPIPTAPCAHFNGRGRGHGQHSGYNGRGSFNGGRGRVYVPPPPRGSGGLLDHIDHQGLNVHGQRGGRGGGTHARGKRSGWDRHDRNGGPSRDNGGLEDRPKDGAADLMDVDEMHAGSAETENCDDEERERLVSPCVSGVGDPENQEFDQGRI